MLKNIDKEKDKFINRSKNKEDRFLVRNKASRQRNIFKGLKL